MKKVVRFAIALLCFSGEAYAGAGGGTPGQVTADGLIEFDPPQAVACIAIRVDVPETKMVAGLRWFNGSSSEAFPEVLVASGSGMVPPPVAEAVVADSLVSGLHYQWSEITFNDPVASQSGTLFILLKYPTNYDPVPGADALGVGYANQESSTHYYVTGDGTNWIKVSMNCRVFWSRFWQTAYPGL